MMPGTNPLFGLASLMPNEAPTKRQKVVLIGLAAVFAGVAVRLFWPDQASRLRAAAERSAQPHAAAPTGRGNYR